MPTSCVYVGNHRKSCRFIYTSIKSLFGKGEG